MSPGVGNGAPGRPLRVVEQIQCVGNLRRLLAHPPLSRVRRVRGRQHAAHEKLWREENRIDGVRVALGDGFEDRTGAHEVGHLPERVANLAQENGPAGGVFLRADPVALATECQPLALNVSKNVLRCQLPQALACVAVGFARAPLDEPMAIRRAEHEVRLFCRRWTARRYRPALAALGAVSFRGQLPIAKLQQIATGFVDYLQGRRRVRTFNMSQAPKQGWFPFGEVPIRFTVLWDPLWGGTPRNHGPVILTEGITAEGNFVAALIGLIEAAGQSPTPVSGADV